jgi:predicted O-linked N-acetylglucosamine transferase (SPINDLY family)
MDYRIVDNWTDPEGMTEPHNSETLIRLPSGFLCYTPELPKTEVTELPAIENQYVTFGSFNVFPKLTDHMKGLWAKILLSVPNSKLLIKAKYFIEKQNVETMEQWYESQGVSKDRLILVAITEDTKSHLETYNRVDIHLDSFPYNGTTTTCEALWQGVPTVTLVGNTHRSRVGYSILSQVGLDEFITHDDQQYIDVAVSQAASLDKLTAFRRGMRDRLQSSKLLNATLFMEEFEGEMLRLI